MKPATADLQAMGEAWAEEHWLFDRTYDRFGFDWAYASLDGVYADDGERRAAASTICDHAGRHFAALRALSERAS